MNIACGTVSFRNYPLQEAMERIRRAGYEWVEPQATAPFCPHIDVDRDDPEQFKRLVADMGFKGATALWATHGAVIPDPLSVEYVTKCLQWARAAGIPVVNLGDGVKPEGMSEQQAWGILEQRLLEIVAAAESNQVHAAIEPHGTFSLTADGLQRIMGISDSPWLGINYDTANVHRATYVETREGAYTWELAGEKQDEVATLRRVIDRVVHVHVKDVVGAACVALGEGEVDNAGCIRVLREAGYDGVLSLETEGDFDADEGQKLIEQSRDYLLELVGEQQ